MMYKFNEMERNIVVSNLNNLGLYEIAEDFRINCTPRLFNTVTGKMEILEQSDIRHLRQVNKLYDGSKTYLIVRAVDIRGDIGTVDFFLGIDDDYTDFISAEPEGGAIIAPAYYQGYDCRYNIESFMYSKLPDEKEWHILTSIQKHTTDTDCDDDDLPF